MTGVPGLSIAGHFASAAFGADGLVNSLLSKNYLPHRFCYRAQPGLVWTNVASDALIAVSYVAIFIGLVWIARKLRRLPQLRGFIWIFVAFGTFILSCAVTHAMELITVWLPFYPLSAALKVVCAAVSIPTAILFVRVAPKIVGNISTFFDLLSTAHQDTEEALSNYRGQIEAIDRSQMMIEFNMDGTICRANENYLRDLGYSGAELEGKHHCIFLTEEYRNSAAYSAFWTGLRNGVFQSGLYMHLGKGGAEVWIEASCHPVLGSDGSPVRVVEFATDVTKRIAFQSQLKDAEERLKSILNSVADGIITIDAMGAIVSLNPAAIKMFEYEEHAVAGKNINILMPKPGREAHDGYLAHYVSTGQSKAIGVGRELEGLTGSGRVFPMELIVSEMVLQGQKFFVGLVRDITERSRQEKALRKSEALLDRTGRLAAVGGWGLDLVTEKVTWSNETCRLLGFENDHLPTLEEGISLYTPEGQRIIRAAIEQSMADGKDWEVVVPVNRTDGVRIWARVTASAEFSNGKPVRLVGAFQDITSRVAEQEALDSANACTALATGSCGIGIWDWDLRSGKFDCDATICRLFGLDPESGKLRDLVFWAGRVHSEDRAAVEQALQDGIAGVKNYDCEFRNLWDDGSLHHIRATGTVIRDINGIAVRMVGTNVDITASKQAEEALREQASLLDLTHDGILVRELDGAIRLWNCGAEQMYGYSKQQAQGRISHKLLMTVFPQSLAEIDAEFLRKGSWEGELEHTTESGSHIVVHSRWVLQRMGTGAPSRVLETNNDISVRKRAEQQSLRNMQALERSNRELDEFAFAASHDLKAPLRIICNASKWLEEDLELHLTGETRENMGLIRGRAQRMERLLDDLLEYSRIGRVKDARYEEMISGEMLLKDVLELLSPPPDFKISYFSPPAGIQVCRMPLQQILMNLIGNAIKHHDKKNGIIEVSVEDLGTKFAFAVKDDGPGIPARFHERIFKMFQTLKPRDQVEGSGMGLAMVQKHIGARGGEIKLESAEGQGSVFRFTWPKQQTT